MSADDSHAEERAVLARGARLHHDEVRARWVLLGPELVVQLDAIALEVLRRLDGRPLDALASELAALYDAPPELVRRDVRELLCELSGRGLVRWA